MRLPSACKYALPLLLAGCAAPEILCETDAEVLEDVRAVQAYGADSPKRFYYAGINLRIQSGHDSPYCQGVWEGVLREEAAHRAKPKLYHGQFYPNIGYHVRQRYTPALLRKGTKVRLRVAIFQPARALGRDWFGIQNHYPTIYLSDIY